MLQSQRRHTQWSSYGCKRNLLSLTYLSPIGNVFVTFLMYLIYLFDSIIIFQICWSNATYLGRYIKICEHKQIIQKIKVQNCKYSSRGSVAQTSCPKRNRRFEEEQSIITYFHRKSPCSSSASTCLHSYAILACR